MNPVEKLFYSIREHPVRTLMIIAGGAVAGMLAIDAACRGSIPLSLPGSGTLGSEGTATRAPATATVSPELVPTLPPIPPSKLSVSTATPLPAPCMGFTGHRVDFGHPKNDDLYESGEFPPYTNYPGEVVVCENGQIYVYIHNTSPTFEAVVTSPYQWIANRIATERAMGTQFATPKK